ncbi:MAG: alanine--tRNA ligase [Candidatus Dormiibacterota bacterium]
MLSAQIRQSFLNFFAGQDHQVLPSSSLVPHEDTSVLLTTAGMQQFKPYFMGQAEPPTLRATTVQKCFRTKDLDEVGDLSHLTFFEMLGNFSFGDYFKEGAIEYAWQYLTRELGIDPIRLQPTIHPDDEESAGLWPKITGKMPTKLSDNFWAAGPTGPCGPDSEIHFDWGPSVGCGRPDCYPSHCNRYVELWNLVFMQFDRKPDGTQEPLSRPGVDTGMGLERLAAVLALGPGEEREVSVYETDILGRLQQHFAEAAVQANGDVGRAQRLLSDHARGTTFLVADGVRAGNEGRGYVLRRMVRRATLQASRVLGIEHALSGAVPAVVELMGDAYPELRARQDAATDTLMAEETAFQRTLESGQAAFAEVVGRSSRIIPGEDAFRLHDTFGFPIDLTVELAAEAGLSVDRAGFEEQLAAARQRSRRGAKTQVVQRTGLPATEFVGYESMTSPGQVTRLFSGDKEAEAAIEGEEVEVYLDRTPMYAESGGQVGDIGVLEGPEGTVQVRDVQRQGEASAHFGRVESGRISAGDRVQSEVDEETRWATMRHHSATHLLHRALRQVLGENASQAGSFVGPETCTFDFHLDRAVGRDELEAIFRIVNRAVREDLPRTTRVMALEEARQSGAVMLFGEKYGDTVRVVSFGDFSTELCGGTHVERSGQIGSVVPVAEKSIGAGLRRIEFLAGEQAERHQRAIQGSALAAADALHVAPDEVAGRVEAVLSENRKLQKQVQDLSLQLARGTTGAVSDATEASTRIGGGVASRAVTGEDADLLRHVADSLLDQDATVQAAVVMGREGDAGRLVVKTRGGGLSASDGFGRIRESFGGKGGGSATLAQGGGFKAADFADIVAAAEKWVAESGTGNGTGGKGSG